MKQLWKRWRNHIGKGKPDVDAVVKEELERKMKRIANPSMFPSMAYHVACAMVLET